MDFRFSQKEERFREEVQDFLKETLPSDWDQVRMDPKRATAVGESFARRVRDKGWHMLAWPEEWGGQGRSIMEQLVFNEEMTRRHAPPGSVQGLGWVGPLLMLYGNEEQKQRYLTKLISGEEPWCTLYSEPESGSDLASLQTRAQRDGDFFVVNGEKVWTSGAHRAQWGLLACRSDPDAPKHRGISMLIMDMSSPGVAVQPLVTMENGRGFNQVLLDNVRIPVENVLGELNHGWRQMNMGLQFERSSTTHSLQMVEYAQNLADYAKMTRRNGRVLAKSPVVRNKLADVAIRAAVARALSYRVAWMQSTDQPLTYEASIDKLFVSELEQHASRVGMELLGLSGQFERDEPRAPLGGTVEYSYLWNVAYTISRGSSEIQRNITATRGLGLPRD